MLRWSFRVHLWERVHSWAARSYLAAPFIAPYLSLMNIISETSQNPEMQLLPAAAKRVRTIAEAKKAPAMLRLSVEGGGCSGFQYKFDLAEEITEDDLVVEEDGVKLLVDSVSLDLLRGSAVDFVESLGGRMFQVTNPNAQAGCGCGTSFAV